jgi:hypothetical protein
MDGKVKNNKGCVPHRGIKLDKGAQFQVGADHAGEVLQATLEGAGEKQEFGLCSNGGKDILQFTVECSGLAAQSFVCEVMASSVPLGVPAATSPSVILQSLTMISSE